MSEFSIGNLRIPYSLKRSGLAKHIRIEMTIDAMNVTAPTHSDLNEIENALSKKRRWIVENYTELKKKYEKTHKIARFRTGAKIPYWGRLTKINTAYAEIDAPNVVYKNGLYISLAEQNSAEQHDKIVERAIQHWMRARLKAEARAAVLLSEQRLDVKISGLRIANLINVWGSCGENGTISIDWHLVFAPKRVMQYVIAHEIGHLIHRNHSQKFWNTLRIIFGDCKIEHDWILKNEHLLGYQKIPVSYGNCQRDF